MKQWITAHFLQLLGYAVAVTAGVVTTTAAVHNKAEKADVVAVRTEFASTRDSLRNEISAQNKDVANELRLLRLMLCRQTPQDSYCAPK